MSQPELRALLEPETTTDPGEEGMSEEQRFLLRHFPGVAALLAQLVELVPVLRAQRLADGWSLELQEEALDEAEKVATLMQSLKRRHALVVALQGSPWSPTVALALLDQLFFSLLALAGRDDDYADAALDEEQIGGLLAVPDLERWLIFMGAQPEFVDAIMRR